MSPADAHVIFCAERLYSVEKQLQRATTPEDELACSEALDVAVVALLDAVRQRRADSVRPRTAPIHKLDSVTALLSIGDGTAGE